MEWVIAFILIIGGVEIAKGDGEKVKTASVAEIEAEDASAVSGSLSVEKEAVFARGRYFRHQHGYFISDLSPEPVQVCSPEVLVADLKNRPSPDDQELEVTVHKANCEG